MGRSGESKNEKGQHGFIRAAPSNICCRPLDGRERVCPMPLWGFMRWLFSTTLDKPSIGGTECCSSAYPKPCVCNHKTPNNNIAHILTVSFYYSAFDTSNGSQLPVMPVSIFSPPYWKGLHGISPMQPESRCSRSNHEIQRRSAASCGSMRTTRFMLYSVPSSLTRIRQLP